MPSPSFETVAALDDLAQHQLLRDGTPVERVWALWALAARCHDGAAALAGGARREPHGGVRRHFAVVLAAHGHHDLLVALAHLDPDAEVRAAAAQLITRLAGGDAIPWSVVLTLLRGEIEPVRLAVLGELSASAPAPVRAAVLAATTAPSTCLAAFEAVARGCAEPGERLAQLAAVVAATSADDRWLYLDRWLAIDAAVAVLGALHGVSVDACIEVMNRLGDALTWADVAALDGSGPALRYRIQLRFQMSRHQVPLPVLVRWHATDVTGGIDTLVAELRAVRSVDTELASALRGLRDRCESWLDETDAALAAAAAAPQLTPTSDDDDEWGEDSYEIGPDYWAARAVEVAALRLEIERLIGSG